MLVSTAAVEVVAAQHSTGSNSSSSSRSSGGSSSSSGSSVVGRWLCLVSAAMAGEVSEGGGSHVRWLLTYNLRTAGRRSAGRAVGRAVGGAAACGARGAGRAGWRARGRGAWGRAAGPSVVCMMAEGERVAALQAGGRAGRAVPPASVII